MNKIVGGRDNQVNIAEQHYEQYCRGEGCQMNIAEQTYEQDVGGIRTKGLITCSKIHGPTAGMQLSLSITPPTVG